MSGKLVCICYDDVFEKEVFDQALEAMNHRGPITKLFTKASDEAQMVIARDRLGINPLYWMETKHGFLVASEVKAFLPFVKKYNLDWSLNKKALHEYIMFRYTAGPYTLIEQVNRLLPGEKFNITTPYATTTSVDSELKDLMSETSKGDLYSYIEGLLYKAVEASFDKDECAVILSGGVDSSLLTAIACSIGRVPSTVSMVFDGYDNSELEYSRAIAYRYETKHTEIHFSSEDFADNYLKAVWHNDEPINFPNSVAIMYMSGYIKNLGFNKVMAGEGADEIFAGYGFFTGEGSFKCRTIYNKPDGIADLLASDIKADLSFRDGFKVTTLNDRMWYTFHTYLQTVCNRLDKMTRAYGVEAVCPFVNDEVVDASMRLPSHLKVSEEQITKYIIKKIAEKYIDYDQIYRPKVGFSVPINIWLRDEKGLGRFVSVLEEPRTLKRDIYNPDGILKLLHDFRNKEDSDKYTYAGRVWALLNLELWIRAFIEGTYFQYLRK